MHYTIIKEREIPILIKRKEVKGMKELEKFYQELVKERDRLEKGYEWINKERKRGWLEAYDDIIEDLQDRLYIKEE